MKPTILSAILGSLVVACAGRVPPNDAPLPPAPVAASARVALAAADESFREAAPSAGPSSPFVPPVAKEFRLANGLRVVLVERHDLPLVAFQLVTPRGADDVAPRVGSLSMELFYRGNRDSAGRTTRQRLDALAVTPSAWGGLDSTGVGFHCLHDKFQTALAELAETVLHPSYGDKEFARVKEESLAKLDKDAATLSNVETWALREAIYPVGHPYREAGKSRAADIRAVTLSDAKRYIASHLSPSEATAVVAGDITASELETELTKVLHSWKASPQEHRKAPVSPRTNSGDGRVFLVDRPGAAQAHVSVVAFGISRTSPDYAAGVVLNRILGGAVPSRLFKNLREQRGLTYSIFSWLVTRHGPGELAAGGAVTRERTGEAVREMLREIERFSVEPVSETELAEAVHSLVSEYPAKFETLEGTLKQFSELTVYGLPTDDLAKRTSQFAAVTPADIMRVAKTYFSSNGMRVIVTADARIVQGDLSQLGLGQVLRVDPIPKSAP